ncbi:MULTISPECIES: hypothetical protein [unclassified Microbacterium]|uniref:hypothetical protein n=1 Tax=unclassified Microbacterium TaxID=2609290 RepID=UPI000CFB139C|nr:MULTISPECIES: hypothetical protein [unclassified Microbacterium]PQZ55086.1 hypothetical protein CQ032_12410 [Microbacterium sp. MYb43]PQZ81470.1 hypothetical protein CQ031_04405 [Microbacterium sp. MYb40]PRB21452.1 hypothetical protein CQ040_08800 [Microbacterium sp. MYb54]PRB30017.1 hypothetical protein CQ037_06420 [Microbacterium sp. MYb50]PRB67825.1 hypothetical protein CQ021_07555 [Microbacterium sp. MYb24]
MKARLTGAAAALIILAALTACTPQSDAGGDPAPSPTGSATSSAEPTDTPSPSASPTSAPVALPTDCRAILSEAVLAELGDTPLNDAAFGPSGVAADGSLTCNWADPRADTTRLTTKISHMNRGPALDMLNALATTEGFSCFTPDGGTRCEKTWPNEQYPVTDGRTLFWRDDVLIDTRYSNLAPAGYTSSIVEHIFD